MIIKDFFSPIQKIEWKDCSSNIYIKRDDLIGFSFGGNKARIAAEFISDMKQKGCDCLIAYGSSQSNMCRAAANMCGSEGIPCYVVTALSEGEEPEVTFNSRMVEAFGARIRYCRKDNVADTIDKLIRELKDEGCKPYYIFGDIYGKGNESTAAAAYAKAYAEILEYMKRNVQFDRIFLASGTGMTQGGLLLGQRLYGGKPVITGISIARDSETGKASAARYSGAAGPEIEFYDDYRCGGYGLYDEEVEAVVSDMLKINGIPMDTTYTGKAFCGMLKWLKEYGQDVKNVLFIHTGGTPLFFDNMLRRQRVV